MACAVSEHVTLHLLFAVRLHGLDFHQGEHLRPLFVTAPEHHHFLAGWDHPQGLEPEPNSLNVSLSGLHSTQSNSLAPLEFTAPVAFGVDAFP
jgi:hypothetical protein